MIDFEIDCKISDIEYDCNLYAKSTKAIDEFGKKPLANIKFEQDDFTLDYLKRKYDIDPSRTIILTYIQKEKNEKLRNIGSMLICSLIKKFNPKIEYIYLYALNDKLIKFYEKLGFKHIENNNMIGKISELSKNCIYIVPVK